MWMETRGIYRRTLQGAAEDAQSRGHGHEMRSAVVEPQRCSYFGRQFTTTWNSGAARSMTVLTRKRDPSADAE